MLLTLCENPFLAATTVLLLHYLHRIYAFFTTVEDGSMDKATVDYLKEKPSVPSGQCDNMVKALEGAPFTESEPECAEQMRAIVVASHIPYSSLIHNPETLLRCSKGHVLNGALWTRFTVQFNLFAGSIVALGSDEQREALVASQGEGRLGCFAFTEKGAGVLSGAGVETTATYDESAETFTITSPTPSSAKTWISQGLYAEQAVILAELLLPSGESKGPHLFWATIADSRGQVAGLSRPVPRQGVVVESLPSKTALRGLDNAFITFDDFVIPRTSLLSRFCRVTPTHVTTKGSSDSDSLSPVPKFAYTTHLPVGVPRMLDLLIFRLLTGRIVLSEATTSHALARLKHNWAYCEQRELWQSKRKRQGGEVRSVMSDMPLVKAAFRDYARTSAVIGCFIAHTREAVAECIKLDRFTYEVVEATCMCKFLGTGFGVDTVSAVRKAMGARGLQEDAMLGKESFLPNACCAAEGDNTIMELKIVQDIVRGRTSKAPLALLLRVMKDPRGRRAAGAYVASLAKATLLGKKALTDGQLLKDIAWARAHMRVVDVWLRTEATKTGVESRSCWLESYGRVLVKFPAPLVC